MRIGYFIDTLISLDIQEIVKIGGELLELNEGVFYRKKI